MLIDQSLLGRKYFTHDPKSVYVIRGILLNGTLLILGEFTPAPASTTPPTNGLVTHKITDIHLLP